MAKPLKPKRDRYLSARGGSTEFLDIHCAQCECYILTYQKDGPGQLFRLYLDRIHEPPELAKLHEECITVKDFQALSCPKCEALIATPMLYGREQRLALRIIHGTIRKIRRK